MPLAWRKIGDPVPGEHAFAGDDKILAERFEGSEELVGLGSQVLVKDDLSVLIENADEEGSGMQIDAGVKSMRLVGDSCIMTSFSDGPTLRARIVWLPRSSPRLKLPSLGRCFGVDPVLPWDESVCHQGEWSIGGGVQALAAGG